MPYACIAMPLNRNFLIIEGVARSQTERSSSTAKRTMCLRLGGRIDEYGGFSEIRSHIANTEATQVWARFHTFSLILDISCYISEMVRSYDFIFGI